MYPANDDSINFSNLDSSMAPSVTESNKNGPSLREK
jgi:hypothetical protein